MSFLPDPASTFPALRQFTYLNTPAYGLLSEPLMEWRQDHDLDHLTGGSGFKERFYDQLGSYRQTIAEFCDTKPDQVYLVPNFSFGWNTLFGGLGKDRHVLLLENEYPSVTWPVEIGKFSRVDRLPSGWLMEKAIEAYFAATPPDIFVFSLVQYLDGTQLSSSFLSQLKRDYPETLLMADATQYIGTTPFSFEESPLDVLGCSGYKWLLAGTGNGFFLVRRELNTLFYSESLKHQPRKEDFLAGKSHLQLHLEPGHLDSMAFGSLNFSLKWLQHIGMDNIGQRVDQLTAYAQKRLIEAGELSPEIAQRTEHGPIFALSATPQRIEALRSRRVVCAIRNGKLRVGFHFYNTEEDVDRLLAILLKST